MDKYRYIYFYTLDHTGTYTTSGYTLPITPFTFIPVFDDGDGNLYSTREIFWDFGDGTTSKSITATHSYSLPGWYNVKCYVLGKGGIGYEDKFSQLLLVKDFITDTLVLTGFNKKTQAGTRESPFEVFRYNSWQTYDPKNPVPYTINLHVTGNNSPILDVVKYEKDKWGHLKATARFESLTNDPYNGSEAILPVNTVETSNEELYVRLVNNQLVFCDKNDRGSCFAGTYGRKRFFYIDDVIKQPINITVSKPTRIFVSFDSRRFKDHDSFNKNYPSTTYPIINTILDANSYAVLMQKADSDRLTITSNGIDSDGYDNPITSFNIYEEKYTNQKIPFVVRIKDPKNSPSKGNKVLTLTDSNPPSSAQVYVCLRDENNNKIDGIQFYSNFGVLSSETYGGFFKGYFISDKELRNVHIHAVAAPTLFEEYRTQTTYFIINEPQYEKVHDIRFQTDASTGTKTLVDTIRTVDSLSGIYSSCVVTRLDPTSRQYVNEIWLVDADRDKISKYDGSFNVLYNNFTLPDSCSPSDICADSSGDVWVTLYDSISVLKISTISNLVYPNRIIVSSLANQIINEQNTITPASIDTDRDNNVWVSYSNQLSSFIEKYNSVGGLLVSKILDPAYQITEIVTDRKMNVWGIMKDKSVTNTLSSKNDQVFKIDKSGQNVEYFSVQGSLWNITIDVYDNIWVTKNINQVAKINNILNTINTYTLPTVSVNDQYNYISDLEGIACTTENIIVVVDNKNKKLHSFDSDVDTSGTGFIVESLDLHSISNNPVNIQDKLNAYGDWNGFKFINKYVRADAQEFRILGDSNTFSIYSNRSGGLNIRKLNENFDLKTQINSYRFQEYLVNSNILFQDFIGTIVGDSTSSPAYLGKLIYEKISNFTDNVNNIDTCNIQALESMYSMFDETLYSFKNNDYNFPAELNRLVDIFSINFSKIKGSRNKFDQNYDKKGYTSVDSIYGTNKGDELNFFTSVLTAGVDIIAYEKFSETYQRINTNLLSSSYINFIDPVNKTYALSSYHKNWGWGLSLPDEYVNEQIPRYYQFFEYKKAYLDLQTEGLINWADPYNTISEKISSVNQWDQIKNKMITYSLAKGLGVIK